MKIMIDHVILTVSDFRRSVACYAKALKPLGITTLIDYEGKEDSLIPSASLPFCVHPNPWLASTIYEDKGA